MERNAEVAAVIRALGGPSKIGRMLGISRQAVSKWRKIPKDREKFIRAQVERARRNGTQG